jgi:hypothetical protein
MIVTILSTLTAVVGCMAMGANSTPAQIHALKLWMAGLSLLGLAGVVMSIVLLRSGQTGWAAFVAFFPTIVITIISLIALLK